MSSEQQQFRLVEQANDVIATEVIAVLVWDFREQGGEKGDKFPHTCSKCHRKQQVAGVWDVLA